MLYGDTVVWQRTAIWRLEKNWCENAIRRYDCCQSLNDTGCGSIANVKLNTTRNLYTGDFPCSDSWGQARLIVIGCWQVAERSKKTCMS